MTAQASDPRLTMRSPGVKRISTPPPNLPTKWGGTGASSMTMGRVSAPVPLRLRPLEIGDVLDETFRMYRRHFALFAGISVIFSIPLAALSGYGYFALFNFAATQATSSNPGDVNSLFASLSPRVAGVLVNVAVLPLLYG